MKEAQEVRVAWVIWNLLSHLNDRLWDYYENGGCQDCCRLLERSCNVF